MPIFENRGNYLFVKITEPYSLKLTFSILQEFADACNRENLEKALIDMLALEDHVRNYLKTL
jgi:hypothetical protein